MKKQGGLNHHAMYILIMKMIYIKFLKKVCASLILV